MPIVTVYRHGATAGVPPMKNDHLRALRGEVGGWSEGATRRNTRFLYSIREDLLTGAGMAITLTLRTCPESAQAWHRIRRAWEMRMVRAGMTRLHWVTGGSAGVCHTCTVRSGSPTPTTTAASLRRGAP